ncbi:FimV/HubP family polar landmark protein [Luteimonas sp. RD2P54]|uniref:FimV/HubP family polar landmark protein n=1 Tax=Luteimonas endophytica TaxID=3042023 RepID=A0ABT6JB99_9GAMM|nr:FimV/HubP family polar landmark protein [Luteimonas endophytica]MDH5823448.1 FimV/HubP family polar landmark protein [Luteimonas endophytica]
MLLKWRYALILVLALVAGPAAALGLGQIQVRSQYGEPFLAEIPIVSSDPAELQQLRARLASPDTFARIGLEPPQGVVSDLQFTVALDASGRPVVRVTSVAPVEQPLLTFLVEVDWGQGRLVREYSALVDAPDTVAAPAQPPIQAPAAAPAGTIVRPPEAPPAAEPAEPVAATEPAPAEAEAEAGAATASEPEPAAAPVPAPPPAPAPAATAMSVPGEYGPVQAGDTLSQIVQRIGPNDGVTQNQMMLALLRANPEAFIGGNVNLVRQGAVLRIPPREDATSLSATEATAEVRAQVARWRELSAPAPQPDAAVAQDEGAGAGAGAGTAEGGEVAAAGAQARLEIVPPSTDGGQQAGTRSGITAGGEGEMLRQDMQETRETLAAREAEVEELQARVAELEALQQQQQRLLALKDGELAAAQQTLAESNRQQAAGADAASSGGLGWLWPVLAVALLLAAAGAWLWSRRNRERPVRSFRAATASPVPAPNRPGTRAAVAGMESAGMSAARPVSGAALPTWHSGDGPPAAAPAGTTADPADAPAEPGTEAGPAGGGASAAAAPAAPAAAAEQEQGQGQEQERIELARAYIDLGDVETARGLLREVAGSGGPGERSEAERMLRELG